TNYERLQANQNEHVALMVLVLERDSMPAQKLIEAHIMTPVEIIKKNLP
ncbi:MAG: GntR family transcriptional regulator, partial [Gammaproteobacteria bacterium]|nr:GntR family transcriptional regulator [Gammaproteobacteria bacterium]